MGKKILDLICPYCGKRYNKEEQKSLGNIDDSTVGEVLWCPNPKCEQQSIIK